MWAPTIIIEEGGKVNHYEITKCPNCQQPIITSEVGTVRVAGWKELDKVLLRLRQGESLQSITKDYCLRCLFPIESHSTEEEHRKHPNWLPYHKPQPQEDCNRYV